MKKPKMSKKTNTLLFILGGTVFNILVTIVSILVLLVIYSRFFYSLLPESTVAWVIPVIFTISILVSFFVYRLVLNLIMKKVDMEKYFDPIFKSRRPLKKN